MAKAETTNGKREALARDGALNPHPEAVRDALFADNPFFDPADLVQVRYEMVRRHEVDGQVISAVATNFGVSRPTFYKAQAALAAAGLAGLLPAQRGPKAGHKLSAEILAFDADLRGKKPGDQHVAAARRDRGVSSGSESTGAVWNVPWCAKKNDARWIVHVRHPASRRLRDATCGGPEWSFEWPMRPRDHHSPRAYRMARRADTERRLLRGHPPYVSRVHGRSVPHPRRTN